jgi:hypothetical protein
MGTRSVAGAALALMGAVAPVQAAEDAGVARLAACQDSWMDWQKTAPEKLDALAAHFRAGYSAHGNTPYYLPKTPTTIAGLKLVQLYPISVGMGVGLSVLVDAPLDKAKATFEAILGKKVGKCEASDGMHACEIELAPKRDFTVMTVDTQPKQTLVGCYYFYEK